ncbi:exported hypothetical protein [Cupriavidus taiwanensis]|uniref:Uncharacterized protein n=1 Tax=Cupriavidus taiwanensis TaxID=164546 RepID=A0A375JC07_9BURK|nr:exported hypothetical protein [Cupriavidus taiwanensis]
MGRDGWSVSTVGGVVAAAGATFPVAEVAAVDGTEGAVLCVFAGLPPAEAIAAATGFDIADAALAGAAAERPTVATIANAAGVQR